MKEQDTSIGFEIYSSKVYKKVRFLYFRITSALVCILYIKHGSYFRVKVYKVEIEFILSIETCIKNIKL